MALPHRTRAQKLTNHTPVNICNYEPVGPEVDATSIHAFKSKLDRLTYTRMGFFMDQSADPRPPGGIPASEAAQGEYYK